MRIPMAIVLLLAGGVLALGATADAASKHKKYKRIAKEKSYKAQRARERRLECERAEQEDPTGQFKGFPCWAREAFGRASKVPDPR